MSDQESARQQAREDHSQNKQSPMATPQSIPNADVRNAYNAELDRQRKQGS